MLVPKEQPPWKLSGQRTSKVPKGLWREAFSLAEGITISGKGTEGARGYVAVNARGDEPARCARPGGRIWTIIPP